MADPATLRRLGVVDLARAIASGDVTAEDAASACLEGLRTVGARLNCVVRLEEEEAMVAAREVDRRRRNGHPMGPLEGVPLACKDIFFRHDRPCGCGSPIMDGFVASETATVLDRLSKAGALYLGALHLPEFARGTTGQNETLGPCRNPWNEDYVTGGSSSGSAAAVAARLVPGALGTDTAGSIRFPASMCGVVGLKPTYSLVSRAGVMPLSWSLDCVGTIARTALDCARLLSVLGGHDPVDPTSTPDAPCEYEPLVTRPIRDLKVGIPENYFFDQVADPIARSLDAAVEVLKDAGAAIEVVRVPDMMRTEAFSRVVREVEAATVHAGWMRTRAGDYSSTMLERTEQGLYFMATRYCEALNLRALVLGEFIDAALKDADVLFVPAVPIPTPRIADFEDAQPDEAAALMEGLARTSRAVNYLGLPAIVAPCGFLPDGLPIAFQLFGRPFSDPLLLRVVHQYQARTEWHQGMPPAAFGPAPEPM